LARQNERLTREIRQLRGQLQSLIEEHETTSEEFKTANEEVLSSNEELQSTNEELETAKEELQSTNEELTTVNEELQNRNLELSTANNDLLNVLENVNIPVVIVSNDVRIRRFTPAAQKLLNLLSSDVGRYLGDIRPNMDFDKLGELARQTIETSSFHEAEVRDNLGVWYMLRTRPYKTSEHKVAGAVITFQDIDAFKHTVEESRAYADTLIETAREAVLILDADLRVLVANPVFYNSFQVFREDTVNRAIFELGNKQWNIPALRTLLEKIVQQKARVDDFEVTHSFEHLGERVMILNARRLNTKQSLIFLTIEDVTERRKANEALEKQAELLKQSEETLRRLSAYLMTLQDEERRRIARELHDSTGQKLAAAKLQLDSLVKSGNIKSYEKIVSEASQWIDECFQEVRTLSQLLHPPLLDEAGLISATRWMVDGFSARANIKVDLQITGEFGRLPQPVELALFRVVQESLSNIRRHSGATKAQIKLARHDGHVRLEISDNGKGIPPQLLAKSGRINQVVGVGILGMRERLAQLGGHLDIDSNQAGTTVKVSVPLAAAATP
jgi:two-component system CheB/CheR fusion protein